MRVVSFAPSGRWSGIACLDISGEILACRTKYLRRYKKTSRKAAMLRREVDRLIARFHPTFLVVEHSRPGTKSPAEPFLVRAIMSCARRSGIPTVPVSRCEAAISMSGCIRWVPQLKALRRAYYELGETIPENPKTLYRVHEAFRTLRPRLTALSIAHVMIYDRLLSRIWAKLLP